MRIVTQPELDELVDGEHIGNRAATLHVENIQEFRTNLRIRRSGTNRGVVQDVDKYQDRWQLQKGKPYIVQFEESLNLPQRYGGFIQPSGGALSVGGVAQPRITFSSDLWTLFVPFAPVDVDDGATLGFILIAEFYNPSDGKEDVTE